MESGTLRPAIFEDVNEESEPSRPNLFAAESDAPTNEPPAESGEPRKAVGDNDDSTMPHHTSSGGRLQEFLIPIHGFVHLRKKELKVIDHPAYQRLFRINQLGQTNLVYRGATHRRGEHLLGALAAVELLIEALESPSSNSASNRWTRANDLTGEEKTFVRLAVLLHDIGHVAAGHTFEDELGLLAPHDSIERLKFIFDRKAWGSNILKDATDASSKTLRDTIDKAYSKDAELANVRLNGRQLSATEIVIQIVAKDVSKDGYQVDSNKFRPSILRDLVGNTICADLIDYLHRDWHHIGKPRYLDTRLLQYMEIGRIPNSSTPENRKDQVVVNLQSSSRYRYRPDAVTEILGLLESRYQLWEIALLHRTKTAASAMLERAIMEIIQPLIHPSDTQRLWEEDRKDLQRQHGYIRSRLLEAVLECSDESLYSTLADDSWISAIQPDARVPDISRMLFWRLQHRVLHKELARVDSFTTDKLNDGQKKRISSFLATPKNEEPGKAMKFETAQKRLVSLRNLEEEFRLPVGSLAMYCTPFGLGQKLADAKVLYDDEVWKLRDAGTFSHIDGGHLKAQLQRFHRLWRASLFGSPEAFRMIDKDNLSNELREAFSLCVLGMRSRANLEHTDAEIVRDIAAAIVERRRSKILGPSWKLRDDVDPIDESTIVAARDSSTLSYPSGVPRIVRFLKPSS